MLTVEQCRASRSISLIKRNAAASSSFLPPHCVQGWRRANVRNDHGLGLTLVSVTCLERARPTSLDIRLAGLYFTTTLGPVGILRLDRASTSLAIPRRTTADYHKRRVSACQVTRIPPNLDIPD